MMDKLKKIYLKSAQLCDDYVDSLEYEKCDHHIVETFDSGGRVLLLIETLTGKIVKEVEECRESLTNSKITINISLEILNSISTKSLFQIIKDLYEYSMGTEVNWYYEEYDENMLEEGCDLKELLPKAKFNLISVKDLRKVEGLT